MLEWESEDEREVREIMRKIKWDRFCLGCFVVKFDIWEGLWSFVGLLFLFVICCKGIIFSDCCFIFVFVCFRSRL